MANILNLIRADFYKLKRSKSFYLCTAVIGIITALVMSYTIFFLAYKKELIYSNTLEWVYLLFKESGMLPVMITFFQAIFITMFVTTEFSAGTIRDPVTLGYNRAKIFISKLITVIIGSFFMMLVAIFSTYIIAIPIVGVYGTFTGTHIYQLILSMLIEGLLFAAFASIFVMIAFIIKNMGGTMALSFSIIFLLGIIGSGVSDGIWRYLCLLMNFSLVAMPNPDINSVNITVSVAFCYLLICSSIGGFVFAKEDMK